MRYMQAERLRFGWCRSIGVQMGRRQLEVPVMRARAGWYGCPVAVVIAAAALLPTAAVAADPVTFSATGAAQTYAVPPGVTSITATVNGAAGGAFSPGSTPNVVGKNGGQTKATLLVAPGTVLTLVVGKAGSVRGAGTSVAYGGGGAAGGSGGAGGGGGSFVFGPTGTLLLAAGGGGGFGGVFGGGEGAGTGTVGLAGGPGTATGRVGGAPGTETAGGAAGSTGGTAGGGPATVASFATGGAGGGTSGGGGGGGYFGGGGGGSPDGVGAGGGGQGGGGGSGYASPNTALVTGTSGSVGTQAGDGQITFVPNQGPVPPPPVAEQCANGIDDDHDGFTDAVDPQCKLNRGSEGPVDNPLIACTDNDIVLVNVTRAGGRVLVSGIADRRFQGRNVEIFAGDTKAGDAVVADNGSFVARLPAPSARKARTIRYQARLDQSRSPALKLARHMSVTTARVSGTAVVFAGRVTGSRRKRAVVDLLGRTGGCNSHKFVVVARARLRPDGSFRVTAKPFPDLAIAIYRARTTIPGGHTFTLPQAVKLR
jgi:hypothetical protein